MRSARFLLVPALALVLAGCARSTPDGAVTADVPVTEDAPGLFAQAAISGDSAAAIARTRAKGVITKATLEREGDDSLLLYSFDFTVPGESDVTEVHVDARTGVVLVVKLE